jgi:hypothetical protein
MILNERSISNDEKLYGGVKVRSYVAGEVLINDI